jgi:hypothetical protein
VKPYAKRHVNVYADSRRRQLGVPPQGGRDGGQSWAGGAGRAAGTQRAPCLRWWWNRPGRRGCRSRCSSVPAATPWTGSARPKPTTCGGCCRAMPSQRHRRRHLARLLLVDPAGLHPPSCRRRRGRRWTAACGLVIGSPARPPPTSAASPTWSISCCRQAHYRGARPGRPGRAPALGRPHALVAAGRARLQRVLATASAGHRRPVAGRRPRRAPAVRRPPRDRLWPPRSPARSGCCVPPRPSWPTTPATGALRPAGLARSLPGLATIGGLPWPPPWQGQSLRQRQQVPLLHRPDPKRRRPATPTARPTHQQGRQPAAADHPSPRRRPRPPPRPQLARSYHTQMSSAATTTSGGLCSRRPPGRARLDGHGPRRHRRHPGYPAQAKAIIADHWTVPEQVRRRRRSRKGRPSASPYRTCTSRSKRNQATLPSLATVGQQPSRVKPTQPQP